jgi:hypothetical protein
MQEETNDQPTDQPEDQPTAHTGTGTHWPALDGVVLVPTDGPWHPGEGDPQIRLGQAPDGAPVALAYTSPAALTHALGQHPWIAVRHAELLSSLRPLGVEHFLIDGHPVTADA